MCVGFGNLILIDYGHQTRQSAKDLGIHHLFIKRPPHVVFDNHDLTGLPQSIGAPDCLLLRVRARRQVKQVDIIATLLQVQTGTVRGIAGDQDLADVRRVKIFNEIGFLALSEVRGQYAGIDAKRHQYLADDQLL